MNKTELDNIIREINERIGQQIELSVSAKPNKPYYKTFTFKRIVSKVSAGFADPGKPITYTIPLGLLESDDGVQKKKPIDVILNLLKQKENQ